MSVTEQLRACPHDGEPVVFTFEYPGAEYVCVVCGWLGGIFDPSWTDATPMVIARSDELHERYERERAERTGLPMPLPQPAATDPPSCTGCGKQAEGHLTNGKPRHWFSRTIDGVTEYACSRSCIAEGKVLPW